MVSKTALAPLSWWQKVFWLEFRLHREIWCVWTVGVGKQKTELMSLQGTGGTGWNAGYVWALCVKHTLTHSCRCVWMGRFTSVLQHMSHIFWPPVSCETRTASNPSTLAQVNMGVILSLPSSARRSPVVFSSALLFVSAWHHEAKPLARSSLEIPTPTVFPQVPLFWSGQ